ncbi:MAG: hypothetical protein AAB489_03760 [Patescibacteria group bacterium]
MIRGHTRLFLAAGVLLGLVAVVAFFSIRNLKTDIGEVTADIGDEYTALVTEHVVPLQENADLQPAQGRYLRDIQEAQRSMEHAKTLYEKVTAIQAMQRSSHVFLRSVQEDQNTIRDDAHYQLFARGMGELGEVRKLIEPYNDLAGQWNAKRSSFLASITAGETEDLPLLRFDGSIPDIGVVKLGE